MWLQELRIWPCSETSTIFGELYRQQRPKDGRWGVWSCLFFFGSECTVKYTRTSFIKNKFHLSSWACIGKKKREKWFLYSGSTILYIFFGNTNIMYVPTRGDHVYTKIRVHRVFWIPTCTPKWKLQGVPSASDYWIIIFLGEVTSNKKYGLQWLRVICFPRSVYAFWKRNTH